MYVSVLKLLFIYDCILSICLPYQSLSWNNNELGGIIIANFCLHWEQTNHHIQLLLQIPAVCH